MPGCCKPFHGQGNTNIDRDVNKYLHLTLTHQVIITTIIKGIGATGCKHSN